MLTRFDCNMHYGIKSLSNPRVFCVPADGVPLRIGYRSVESKKLYDWATGPRKKFDDIFSALDTIHEHDGRTDTGRQQRAVASRGKNVM